MVLNFGVVGRPLRCPGDNGSRWKQLGKRPSGVVRVEKAAVSHPRRMWCQAEWAGGGGMGEGVKSSCISYSDKADSEDHAVAAALVLLFAFRLWWGWTFLFLEFPAERQTERKGHQTVDNRCKSHFALLHCNTCGQVTRTGGRGGKNGDPLMPLGRNSDTWRTLIQEPSLTWWLEPVRGKPGPRSFGFWLKPPYTWPWVVWRVAGPLPGLPEDRGNDEALTGMEATAWCVLSTSSYNTPKSHEMTSGSNFKWVNWKQKTSNDPKMYKHTLSTLP